MVYSLVNHAAMKYSFTNTPSTLLELWLAVLPTLSTQQQVRIEGMKSHPIQPQQDHPEWLFHLETQNFTVPNFASIGQSFVHPPQWLALVETCSSSPFCL